MRSLSIKPIEIMNPPTLEMPEAPHDIQETPIPEIESTHSKEVPYDRLSEIYEEAAKIYADSKFYGAAQSAQSLADAYKLVGAAEKNISQN